MKKMKTVNRKEGNEATYWCQKVESMACRTVKSASIKASTKSDDSWPGEVRSLKRTNSQFTRTTTELIE